MKNFFPLFSFLLLFLNASSQQILSEKEINSLVLKTLSGSKQNLSSLKDSVDFYGFAIELNVRRQNKVTVVENISLNDTIGYTIYNDFVFLKNINYINLLKKKKAATIIIPVAIIVAYTKNPISNIPLIKAEELMPKITKLFNKDFKKNNQLSEYIYLDPIICLCSTKVYD